MTPENVFYAPCFQGMGLLLRSSSRQEWQKLVSFCKEQSSIQEESEWATQQIEAAMRT